MKKPGIFLIGIAGVVLLGTTDAAAAPAGIPEGYKLVYEQDFEKPEAMKDFVFTDPRAWKISKTNGNSSLELFDQSKYSPKHRSPFNIALLADKALGDFVLDVELQSTVKPYPHQDMCLFFGFEATNKFYYTHMAVKPDPIKAESHAHDIFIVNDAPRLAIAKEISPGVTWGQDTWHKARVERKIATGSIKVYFDDMSKPIMWAEDKTFGAGYIGFGSFDDLGKIDSVKVYAPTIETRKMDFWERGGN
jgi:hypothetical protein